MISFDQVLLLEERVESAVKKIEQLNAENAALRAKVVELSNALNAKSEQFSSFQSDQSRIEEGILKALSRLNAVENVVLQASGAAQSVSAAVPPQSVPAQPVSEAQSEPVTSQPAAAQPSSLDSLPEEMEIPVHNEDFQEGESAASSQQGNPFSPDVDFDFGDSSQTAPSPANAEGDSSEKSGIEPQALFDIF